MYDSIPIVLVPGLMCSARLYESQIPALWRFGPVTIADNTRDDSLAAIVRRILAAAPPRFALAGLSMGGYICLEIMRQAPERIARLALMDTSARADTTEQTSKRRALIELTRSGKYADVVERLWPILVHRDRQSDPHLLRTVQMMAQETGPEAFIRQQTAIIARPDSRPMLAAIRCPTLVLVGDGDTLLPPELSQEIAQGIAGSKLVVVPDSGHLATLERPQAVNAALEEWVTG